MERQGEFLEKYLSLRYEEYQKRGFCLNQIRIDDYIVFQKIGEGSFGSVYRGMSDLTKNFVALKVIDLTKITSEKNETIRSINQRMSKSQPILMSKCDSDFVIKCYTTYSNKDLQIMVIEYCNGCTLQQEIDKKKRIPEQEAIVIIKHIINGLKELHRHKIIHQDLIAKNIISHNGIYKIMDFGLSKKVMISKENAKLYRTQTSIAPQILSKSPFGRKADIWCLGILFFQMIYGQCPYDSFTCQKFFEQIKENKFFPPKQPLTFNNFKPSQQSHDLLKLLLVHDTKDRPNWNQLCTHPLINTQVHQQINQRFIKQVSVIFDPEENVLKIDNRQSIQQQEERQIQESFVPLLNNQQKLISENDQPLVGVEKVSVMNEQDMKSKKDQINKKISQQFQFAQRAHLECLKTQFIFRQIFNPLELTEYLDVNSRQGIQFMYLLITRCLNNMSIINFQLQNKHKDNQFLKNLNIQIGPFYQSVRQKFKNYSKKLTDCENQWGCIVGDFFKKKFASKNFNQKDQFLIGVQTKDYLKQQQIRYVFDYYTKWIKEKIDKINNISNVIKRLNNFVQINKITREELKECNRTFEEFAKDMIYK